MKVPKHYFQQLAVATFTVIAFNANSVSADIFPDTTFKNQSQTCSGAVSVDKHREITDSLNPQALCYCDVSDSWIPCVPFICPPGS